MEIEKELNYLAVRIECIEAETASRTVLGSGVWWFPDENGEYGYVFTAAHVVAEKTNLTIRYFNHKKEVLEVLIDNDDVAIHVIGQAICQLVGQNKCQGDGNKKAGAKCPA